MKAINEDKSRRVRLKDIAAKLDVSHATVSRALNRTDDPLISEATRLRVLKTAEEMGYRPNHAARSLATGRTGLISLWLWSEGVQNAYHARVSRLMHAEALRHRYQLLVDLVGRPTMEMAARHTFDPWHVDGVIVHEAGPAIEAHMGGIGIPSVPLVSTGSYHLLRGVDRVQIDLSEGAQQAVEHLVESGRRRIVYITDQLESRGQDPRYLAYTKVLAEAGLETRFVDVSSERRQIRTQVAEYIETQGTPDAFYCHNDDIAIAAYRAMRDLGVQIPDDVAIVGCDGIEDTEYLDVPITTIALPLEEMCSLACEFLQRRIENPSHPIQEAVLKARLIVRQSSGGPAA